MSCRCGCREVLHVSDVTELQSYCILNCGENTAKCHEQLPLPPRQKQIIENNFGGFTQSTAEVTRRPNSQTVHFHDLGPKFPKQKVVVQNSFQIVRQARKLRQCNEPQQSDTHASECCLGTEVPAVNHHNTKEV